MPRGRPKGVKNGQGKKISAPTKPMKTIHTTATTVRILAEDYDKLAKEAESDFRSIASLCSKIIHEYINR
jgi:hypothetical protein